MSYIFGKLWHLAIIWAIRKAFQCILQGVRFLLANHTRLSPTSENESYSCIKKQINNCLPWTSHDACTRHLVYIRNPKSHILDATLDNAAKFKPELPRAVLLVGHHHVAVSSDHAALENLMCDHFFSFSHLCRIGRRETEASFCSVTPIVDLNYG